MYKKSYLLQIKRSCIELSREDGRKDVMTGTHSRKGLRTQQKGIVQARRASQHGSSLGTTSSFKRRKGSRASALPVILMFAISNFFSSK
jgi:hypothetical protein